MAHQTDDRLVELEAMNSLSAALYEAGQVDEAIELNNLVLSNTRNVGLTRLWIFTTINRGYLLVESGRFHEAETAMFNGLKMAEESDLQLLLVDVHRNLGSLYQTLGMQNEAKYHFEKSLDLARKLGYHQHETEAIGNLGNIAYERSDLDSALKLHRLAFDRYSRNGDKRGQAIELVNLANVALETSDNQTSFRLFGQALTLFRQIGYKLGQAMAVLGQGHIHYRTKDWELASLCYQETSRLADELHQPELQRVSLTNLGFIHENQTQFGFAEENYRQAIKLTESRTKKHFP